MLLFDHNLSRRLVLRLADIFPDSRAVSDLGLQRASDAEIWAYARENGYTVVAKDSDLYDIATVYGPPPLLVWIRTGNCSTAEIETLLRSRREAITELEGTGAAVLVLL